ncbi:pickpocket protein 28-like [Condylostylus longicornis]|uniref:pickpocket protein 28-like n=1 Tax=Condylostylus longicornis TaxID=2530218 RepID=UPI00244DCC18|nr:pickpocket protein 28-like [Condylostylus longicornis]
MAAADVPSSIRKKIKYGETTGTTWGLFSEYCHHSSIHGVKYLGEPKRSFLERLFWISIFAFSIYGCLSLIGNTWNKWQENPVIVSFNEKSTPVWQIPFPAVTICPELKFPQDKYNYSEVILKIINRELQNITEKENNYTDIMAHVCDYETVSEIFDMLRNDTNMFSDRDEFIDINTIVPILEELIPYDDMPFEGCSFQAKTMKCKELFRKTITKEGICFKWNIEDGYDKNADRNAYPKRSLGSGAKAGLFLWLFSNKIKCDKTCKGPILGFKMLLHAPDEIDDISSQYIQVPLGQQILISIKPKILHTLERLRDYSPETRQCFFQDERYLRYFKYYNQKNCQLECLTNFTYSRCKCVRFDMPRNNDTPICGLKNLKCYNEAEYHLLNEEFERGSKKSKNIFNSFSSTCNCLPACTSIAYETEINQAAYNVTTHYEPFISKFPQEFSDIYEMSRVFIYFKEPQFLTSKRSELYGTTDFLANCGGLLGLFMGVSLLSFGELIYFCTIRLAANLKMRKKTNKNSVKEVRQALVSYSRQRPPIASDYTLNGQIRNSVSLKT